MSLLWYLQLLLIVLFFFVYLWDCQSHDRELSARQSMCQVNCFSLVSVFTRYRTSTHFSKFPENCLRHKKQNQKKNLQKGKSKFIRYIGYACASLSFRSIFSLSLSLWRSLESFLLLNLCNGSKAAIYLFVCFASDGYLNSFLSRRLDFKAKMEPSSRDLSSIFYQKLFQRKTRIIIV